jgi:hypothetical protein
LDPPILPPDAHSDPRRVGVLDYVAESFLRRSEEKRFRLARQLDFVIDVEGGLHPARFAGREQVGKRRC